MRTWLRAFVTIGLLSGIAVYLGGVADLQLALSRTLPFWLLVAFAVITLDRVLMTFKWLLLLKSQGHQLPLLTGIKIYCTAMIWGILLPSTVGADGIRTFLASRAGLKPGAVIASIFIERMIGFVACLAVGAGGLLILQLSGTLDARFDTVWWAGIAILVLAVAFFTASFNRRLYSTWHSWLPRPLREGRIGSRLKAFHHTYAAFGDSRGTLAQFSLLTLLEQFFSILFTWTIAMALRIEVDLVFLAGVVPLTLLISRLPISLDGIGVFESIFVMLMSLQGIPAAESVAIALVGRLIQIAAWIPWWLAHMLQPGAVRRADLHAKAADG